MVNRIFNIINFIYSLYFNFRYLPFKQAVNLPIWITTNFRVHGLKEDSSFFVNLYTGV